MSEPKPSGRYSIVNVDTEPPPERHQTVRDLAIDLAMEAEQSRHSSELVRKFCTEASQTLARVELRQKVRRARFVPR